MSSNGTGKSVVTSMRQDCPAVRSQILATATGKARLPTVESLKKVPLPVAQSTQLKLSRVHGDSELEHRRCLLTTRGPLLSCPPFRPQDDVLKIELIISLTVEQLLC